MIKAIDHLGLAHPLYPLDAVIDETPKGWAIGCFDDDENAFGNAIPALKFVLKSGKFPAVRIHAHWSNAHVIVPMEKLKKKLPKYEKLAQLFPSVKVYVSHSCEHNQVNKLAVMKRIKLIQTLAPSCIPVNSIWQGARVPNIITELHGDITHCKENEIASLDGDDIFSVSVNRWLDDNAEAIFCFGWGTRFNLRDPNETNPPPPKKRTKPPTAKYIKDVVQLMK